MPVFTRLRVLAAASASAAGLLLGGVLGFLDRLTPTRPAPAGSSPDLLKGLDIDCRIEDINMDDFMTDSVKDSMKNLGIPEGYKYISAVGFHGEHFKNEECCNGLRDLSGIVLGAATRGSLETAMPELMANPEFSVTRESCMPKGSPSTFDVSVETKASKDGAEVGPGVCHAPPPMTGPLPPFHGYALDLKLDMFGLSQEDCDSYREVSQVAAKAMEEQGESDEAVVKVKEAAKTFYEQLPDAFSSLYKVTFTLDTTAPAQPPNVPGAMLQALGASTAQMASLGSSLLPVSATAIAAKSRPKEEQATFIM